MVKFSNYKNKVMLKRIFKLTFPRIFNLIKRVKASGDLYKPNNYWAKGVFDDLFTFAIMEKVIKENSATIDVGAAVGDILYELVKKAPNGKHFAFEPQPKFAKYLKNRFKNYNNVLLNEICLSDSEGEVEFNELVADRGYSGMKKTNIAISRYGDNTYNSYLVNSNKLDNIIPEQEVISFIKIDVEGAEFLVLKGADNTIRRCKPVVVFEFGEPAKNYGVHSDNIYEFFNEKGMSINLMEYYLSEKQPLSKSDFYSNWSKGYSNYYVAY
jgi:FkbM family methyltransferase